MSDPPKPTPSNFLQSLRLFSPDIRRYLITSALLGLTIYGGIDTVLLNLYLLRLDYLPEFIGSVNAIGALSWALVALPVGLLNQRYGSRRLMITGLNLAVIGSTLLPLVEFLPPSWQAIWLLGTRALSFLGVGIYQVNANPFIMSATSPDERPHVYAVQFALWPLAGFAGGLIGGFLPITFEGLLDLTTGHPAAYRYALFSVPILLTPAVWAVRSIQNDTSLQRQTPNHPAPFAPILMILFSGSLQLTGENAVRTFFNVYLDARLHMPPALIGALWSAAQFLGIVAALTTPYLTARWGKLRIAIAGAFGMVLCLFPFALIPQWLPAGLALAGLIFFAGIRRPAYTLYHQELVSQSWRGAMSGTTSLSAGISNAAIAFGGGYLISAFGYPTLFLTGAALTTLGTLIFWTYFRTPRGEYARSA